MKVRGFIGVVFLVLQLISIGYARFIPERFFCWGPYDEHTQFEVTVTIDGKTLSSEETENRYRYKMNGWEQRSIYNIKSLISQYERTYGKDDDADVLMIYSKNGHPEEKWRFKP
ncbi:hypothetical protein AB9K26_13215 [Psychroserpens sp. XS_ASV72]|uniref:hypothetical protein n=1 Tax=Psychroserpens sp. XS_ASV72 TaxID=3241293 RepID=UPI0035136810